MSKHAKGAMAAMVSAICFGLMPMVTKSIYAAGSNPLTVVFLRFLITLPPIWIYLRATHVPLAITRAQVGPIALITVAGYGGTALLYFAAFARIPSGLTVTLHFIYPVLVIAGSALWHRRRPDKTLVLSVLLCLVGIALLSGASRGADVLGMVLALLSGVTYAFYMVYLDISGLGAMPPMKLIFYMNALAAALTGAVAMATGSLQLPGTARAWAATVVLALMVSFVAVQLLQVGVRLIGAQRAAILSTFEPLTGVLVGVLVYREPFGWACITGSALVLTAVVLTTLSRPENTPKEVPHVTHGKD